MKRLVVSTLVVCLAAPLAADVKAAQEKMRQKALLEQADLDFAAAMAKKDLAKFSDFVDENATFHGAKAIRQGRDAVAEAWAPLFAPDAKTTLAWKPVAAEIAASGDLGYTLGEATWTEIGADGKKTVSYSRYVTIWKKGADGKWRAAVDIGTAPQPKLPDVITKKRAPKPPGG